MDPRKEIAFADVARKHRIGTDMIVEVIGYWRGVELQKWYTVAFYEEKYYDDEYDDFNILYTVQTTDISKKSMTSLIIAFIKWVYTERQCLCGKCQPRKWIDGDWVMKDSLENGPPHRVVSIYELAHEMFVINYCREMLGTYDGYGYKIWGFHPHSPPGNGT